VRLHDVRPPGEDPSSAGPSSIILALPDARSRSWVGTVHLEPHPPLTSYGAVRPTGWV